MPATWGRAFFSSFSWKALGVDIHGHARTLHINYRIFHLIRMQADRLLGPKISDVDGNTEERHGTVSMFNGTVPHVKVLGGAGDESRAVDAGLLERSKEGVQPRVYAAQPLDFMQVRRPWFGCADA